MVKPDYDYWAAQPEFSRIDAAFLCCDLEPEAVKRGEFGPPKVAAMYRRIADELPNRPTGWNGLTLAGGRGGAVTIGGDSYVSREDLRQWAEATGQRAAIPFLFPEDWGPAAPAKRTTRTDPKAIEPGQVTKREEPSVLKILGAVLQVAYGDDILADLAATRSQRFGEVYKDIRGKMPISEDNLREYVKRIPWEDMPRS